MLYNYNNRRLYRVPNIYAIAIAIGWYVSWDENPATPSLIAVWAKI